MKQWDVVLVGSGISSLTCAALLAKKGRSVCVLERHTKPGGYLHCFKRFGARFDTGAHYVGAMREGQPFHTLLSYLGVYDKEFFIPLDPEGFDELRFPGFQVRFARGYARTIESLASQFPAERAGLERYFRAIAEAASQFPTYEYRSEYDELELMRLLELPLAVMVRQEIRDPRLQAVLFAYCSLHGVRPEDVSFGLHALVTDSLVRGAYGFRHGGDALAERFVKVIEESGGKVLLRSGVRELRASGGQVSEVITERGESFRAEWVISGIHPKATFRLVPDARAHFRPIFLNRLESLPESGGMFGLYAMCRNSARFHPDRNYYFFDDENPETFLRPRTARESPGVAFVCRPDRVETANETAPLLFHAPGPMEWFSSWRETSYGRRSAEYESFKKTRARELIAFVDRFDPGLESCIDKYIASTPITNMHFNGSEEGSAYGIYHSIAHSGPRALGPRTHLKNLLLTGQSSLFPGLLGAAISGLRTAGSLIGMKGILRELSQRRENP